jgi:hypothetical protein
VSRARGPIGRSRTDSRHIASVTQIHEEGKEFRHGELAELDIVPSLEYCVRAVPDADMPGCFSIKANPS